LEGVFPYWFAGKKEVKKWFKIDSINGEISKRSKKGPKRGPK